MNQQRAWALTSGRAPDARGYLSGWEANLRAPMSPSTLSAFRLASGSELRDRRSGPAKMRALHSSAALAVNVFDYWVGRDRSSLVRALELGEEIECFRFEAQLPTGLGGTPPNLDLLIKLRSGRYVGIESKFSEWLMPKSAKRKCFKPKYFPQSTALWQEKGLPACQTLARDIHRGTECFRHLDAPQLLKHALGLASQWPAHFALHYLYFDWPCAETRRHRQEIDRFALRVGMELKFRAWTYQELFARLCQSVTSLDTEYVTYMRSRYFANTATVPRRARVRTIENA